MKQTGYKGMLRDRCPKVVDYALKWCKAKERWIEHTYNRFIKIYANKDNRNNATRIVLGIGKKHKEFDFDKNILQNKENQSQTQLLNTENNLKKLKEKNNSLKNDKNISTEKIENRNRKPLIKYSSIMTELIDKNKTKKIFL